MPGSGADEATVNEAGGAESVAANNDAGVGATAESGEEEEEVCGNESEDSTRRPCDLAHASRNSLNDREPLPFVSACANHCATSALLELSLRARSN